MISRRSERFGPLTTSNPIAWKSGKAVRPTSVAVGPEISTWYSNVSAKVTRDGDTDARISTEPGAAAAAPATADTATATAITNAIILTRSLAAFLIMVINSFSSGSQETMRQCRIRADRLLFFRHIAVPRALSRLLPTCGFPFSSFILPPSWFKITNPSRSERRHGRVD